jgi:GNAT superfamily N-acetyltransferase
MRIRIVDGASTQELRRAVLRPNWPIGSPMHGDENPDAIHFAAVEDDATVIGTCLILPRPYPARPDEPGAWQLRGMATAPDRRNQGIGAAIVGAAIEAARQRDGRLIWCDARTTAVPFYRAHGFATEGAEFLHAESGIPHYRMWRMI